MEIEKAQQDMRQAYIGGATGIFVSGMVWLSAAACSLYRPVPFVILAFFAGGMLIFPLSVLLGKLLGSTGKHSRKNPLGALAMETTFLLVFSLPIVYAVSLARTEWSFPAMLLVIGGRYLMFATLYGMRIYWALGGTLAAAAYALVSLNAGFTLGALVGGSIELLFAPVVYFLVRKEFGARAEAAALS